MILLNALALAQCLNLAKLALKRAFSIAGK